MSKVTYLENFEGDAVIPRTGDWVVSTTEFASGAQGLSTPAVGHDGSATVAFDITGATSASFKLKVSTEEDYDWVTVTLDQNGVEVAVLYKLSGFIDWTEYTVTSDVLSPYAGADGATELRITYARDSDYDGNDNAAYLDDVSFTIAYGYAFANNFSQTLAADLLEGATTLTLDAGGDLLTNASKNNRYPLTLASVDADGVETAWEVVEVTGVSGTDSNVLTIEGGREGTTRPAGGWPAGTTVEMRVTAAAMNTLFEPPAVSTTIPVTTIKASTLDFVNGSAAEDWVAQPGKIFVPLEAMALVTNTPTMPMRKKTLTAANGITEGPRLSPDGTKLAVLSSGLTVWNTADWTLAADGMSLPYVLSTTLEWKPDSTQIAVGLSSTSSSSHETVAIVDVATWTVVTGPVIKDKVSYIRWSSDGALLAVATTNNRSGGRLRVFNTADWTEVSTGITVDKTVMDLLLFGTTLAVATGGPPRFRSYDTSTWAETAHVWPEIYTSKFNQASINPDMTNVATIHDDALYVHRLSDGAMLAKFDVGGQSVAYGPSTGQAEKLAVGSEDSVGLRLFNTYDMKEYYVDRGFDITGSAVPYVHFPSASDLVVHTGGGVIEVITPNVLYLPEIKMSKVTRLDENAVKTEDTMLPLRQVSLGGVTRLDMSKVGAIGQNSPQGDAVKLTISRESTRLDAGNPIVDLYFTGYLIDAPEAAAT